MSKPSLDEKKQWYRHERTGQLGYLTTDINGDKQVRVDNSAMDIRRPLTNEWVPEAEMPPINKAAIKMIAFEADKGLCRSIGLHREASKEWVGLSDEERIKWIKQGPPKQGNRGSLLRQRLYACISEELEEAIKEL